jgi:hypothetical protein
MESFDLIEFQQKARTTADPRKLFELWEDCCRRYERNEIGKYELEEMKDVIWPSLQALASLRKIINEAPVVEETSKPARKRKIS